jgi:hypothetical protein
VGRAIGGSKHGHLLCSIDASMAVRLSGVGVKMPTLLGEAAMDHKTFAKLCDATMAASYHQLEKPEWTKGSEDKPFSDYVHKAAQLVGAITVLADRSRALSIPRA